MTLAIIAGQGDLPKVLYERRLQTEGRPVLCALEQFPPDIPEAAPDIVFRLEHLGQFFDDLLALGVTRVCLAGAVRRPDIRPDLIDDKTRPLVPTIMAAMGEGDDGTLRAIIALFEEHGLKIVGASDLVPDLLPLAGCIGAPLPFGIERDLSAAQVALTNMGRQDLGQAVVVRSGTVIAQEDDRGTDAMLTDLIGKGSGGTLYKAAKPGQDMRADMPVIGPVTIHNAARAGIQTIVIPEGQVMVLSQQEVQETIYKLGMTLWVREGGSE